MRRGTCRRGPRRWICRTGWCLRLRDSLGERLEPVAAALRQRAPVFLRVNLAKGSREAAMAALAGEEITARSTSRLAASALEVTGNARKVQASQAYP